MAPREMSFYEAMERAKASHAFREQREHGGRYYECTCGKAIVGVSGRQAHLVDEADRLIFRTRDRQEGG